MSFSFFGKPSISISQNPIVNQQPSNTETNVHILEDFTTQAQQPSYNESTPINSNQVVKQPKGETSENPNLETSDSNLSTSLNTDANLATILAATARQFPKPDDLKEHDDISKITILLKATVQLGNWDYVYPDSAYTCSDMKQTLDKSVIEHFQKEGLIVSTNRCTCDGSKYICNCPSGIKFSWLHLKLVSDLNLRNK